MRLSVCLLATLLLVPGPSLAQLSAQQLEVLKSGLSGEGNLAFKRLSQQGSFRGCELSFTYIYRDYRARQGGLVGVDGSLTLPYTPGKTFGLFLKVKTADVDVSSGKLRRISFQPAFATLLLGDQSIQNRKAGEITCNGGGICKAFTDDSTLSLMTLFSETYPDRGLSLLVTLNKGGLDDVIALREFAMHGQNKKEKQASYLALYACFGTLVDHISADVERQFRKKNRQ